MSVRWKRITKELTRHETIIVALNSPDVTLTSTRGGRTACMLSRTAPTAAKNTRAGGVLVTAAGSGCPSNAARVEAMAALWKQFDRWLGGRNVGDGAALGIADPPRLLSRPWLPGLLPGLLQGLNPSAVDLTVTGRNAEGSSRKAATAAVSSRSRKSKVAVTSASGLCCRSSS